jgi:hypothetical protein
MIVDLPDEVWKPIEGFDGYFVSNMGRLKSHKRKTPQILKSWVSKSHGYVCTMLYHNKYNHNKRVHILVAEAFIPNLDNLPFVNHKFGNKEDNRATELEWMNQSDNQIHAYQTGLQVAKKGVESNVGKGNESQIHQLCKLLAEGKTTSEIKISMNLSNFSSINSLISRVKNKKAYTDISNLYFN